MDKANNNGKHNNNNNHRDRAICWPYTNRSATHIWPKQVDVCARGMAKSKKRVGKTRYGGMVNGNGISKESATNSN